MLTETTSYVRFFSFLNLLKIHSLKKFRLIILKVARNLDLNNTLNHSITNQTIPNRYIKENKFFFYNQNVYIKRDILKC